MNELELLYSKLQKNGVLIIGDDVHWKGVREAVMQYFKKHKIVSLLNRLDYKERTMMKSE